MIKSNEGMEYLEAFPKLRKWINTCACCGAMGYNPAMPDILTASSGNGEHETFGAKYIRQYFSPLSVNDVGLCEVCERLSDRK